MGALCRIHYKAILIFVSMDLLCCYSTQATGYLSVSDAEFSVWRVEVGNDQTNLVVAGTAFLVHESGYFITAGHVPLMTMSSGKKLWVRHMEPPGVDDVVLSAEVVRNGCAKLVNGSTCGMGYDAALLKADGIPQKLGRPIDIYMGKNAAQISHIGRRCSFSISNAEIACDSEEKIRVIKPQHVPAVSKPYYPTELQSNGSLPYYEAGSLESEGGQSGAPFLSLKSSASPKEAFFWVTALTAWRVPDFTTRKTSPTAFLETPLLRDLLKDLPITRKVATLNATAAQAPLDEFKSLVTDLTTQELVAYVGVLLANKPPISNEKLGFVYDLASRKDLVAEVSMMVDKKLVKLTDAQFPRSESYAKALFVQAKSLEETAGIRVAEKTYVSAAEAYENASLTASNTEKFRAYEAAGNAFAKANKSAEANQNFEAAVSLKTTLGVLSSYGDTLLKEGNNKKATEIFNQAAELSAMSQDIKQMRQFQQRANHAASVQ